MSSDIGARINFKKSHGISIFTPEGVTAEFKSKEVVEFVGYRFSGRGSGIRDSAVSRIKKRISYIIWSNLLEPLQQGHYIDARVAPFVDRDYLVMIMQLRRYLYGNLTEVKLARFRRGHAKRIHYPGVMSYFPLVSDVSQLRELDGWLSHTIFTSLRRRSELLTANSCAKLPIPHGLSKAKLLRAQARTGSGQTLDLSLPSFVRIGTLIQQAAAAHGPNVVGRTGGLQSYQYF